MKKQLNFFKGLILIVELHGLICVTFSYVLAWLDKINVVESLSSTIITEIVAPIIVYGATRLVENIFEKNQLSISTPLSYLDKQSEQTNAEEYKYTEEDINND